MPVADFLRHDNIAILTEAGPFDFGTGQSLVATASRQLSGGRLALRCPELLPQQATEGCPPIPGNLTPEVDVVELRTL